MKPMKVPNSVHVHLLNTGVMRNILLCVGNIKRPFGHTGAFSSTGADRRAGVE